MGMAVKQIPDGGFEHFSEWSSAGPDATYGLPLIWKQSLAVAIGVSGQAFIGILHPPATGLSFAFATHDKWSWGTMVSVFLADLIMVVFAMMYINVSEKKQFPLYWLGLGWSNSEGSIGEINRRAKMLRTRMTGASKKKGEDAV